MTTRVMNRTERLAAIEQMLFRSTIGLRAVEIAEACGVDRRTIYRDLTLLTEVGVPIEQKDGRFYLNRDNYSAVIRLNFDEIIALFLASRVFARRNERYNPHMTSALAKASMALPESVAAHILDTLNGMDEPLIDYVYVTTLETLTRAWGEQRKVKIWYESHGRTKLYEFCTYFVEPTVAGAVHVVGFDSLSQRMHVLDIQRMTRVKVLETPYQIPGRFDPHRYLNGLWGCTVVDVDEKSTVVLAFPSEVAVAITNSLSRAAQRLEVMSDKRYKLTLQVVDWREMLPWIRGWGALVEVLEPQALREALVADAADIVSLYEAQART